MLVIGVANILFAERLTVNNGLGWDGVLYGKWAKDFYNTVVVPGIPGYYTQRFLPSAIVHYSMRLFRVPLDDWHVIHAFDVYNFLLLLLCSYVWGLTSDRLSLTNKSKWIGFFFLFLNYAILKNNFYHSVLTDTSAFTLGLLTFYFFLTDKPLGLLAVILVGGFVWPTVPVFGAILLVFPISKNALAKDAAPRSLRYLVIVLVFMFLVPAARLTDARLPERIALFPGILRVDGPLVFLSIAGVAAYLSAGLFDVLNVRDLFDVKPMWKSVSWKRVAAVVPAFAVIFLLRHVLNNGEIAGWPSSMSFAIHTVLSSLTEPLIFVVAHIVYFGPGIILLFIFSREVCEIAKGYGPGMILVLLAAFVLSINPQSRFLINVAPMVLILVVSAGQETFLKRTNVWFWLVLSLIYSKVWYRFNTGPQLDDGTMNSLLNFPLQHYFMNSGPWMSHQMYLVQGGIILITGLVIYFYTRRHVASPN